MDDILESLNQEDGVKGSMVVTQDGIVVAGLLKSDVRKDVVGALSSFLITATERCLERGQLGALGRMMLTATHGKLIILALKGYFLVTLTDQFADMNATLEAVNVAASRLRKVTRIEV
jgi:predicted regulator of Ras-like GTPase activity (Roadblock/LC7/MglB family)